MRSISALTFTLTGFALGAAFFIAASLVLAWTGPTSAPPNGNVSAPINVGTVDQVKDAKLGVNALAVFGDAILSGSDRYLNFSEIPIFGDPSSGYGIRDNVGTMEFKNSAGSWSSIAIIVTNTVTTAIQNFFASGSSNTVSQIKFADGTTQTSAAGGATSDTVGGGCTGVGEPLVREGDPIDNGGWGNATNCSTSTTCNPSIMSGTCPAGYTATRIGGGLPACIGGSSDCGCGGTFSWPGNATYKPSYYPAPMMCIKD